MNEDFDIKDFLLTEEEIAEIERKAARERFIAFHASRHDWNIPWKIRRAVIEMSNARCEHCGRYGEDMHHSCYERRGNEEPQDIVLLCRRCHCQIHGRSF